MLKRQLNRPIKDLQYMFLWTSLDLSIDKLCNFFTNSSLPKLNDLHEFTLLTHWYIEIKCLYVSNLLLFMSRTIPFLQLNIVFLYYFDYNQTTLYELLMQKTHFKGLKNFFLLLYVCSCACRPSFLMTSFWKAYLFLFLAVK